MQVCQIDHGKAQFVKNCWCFFYNDHWMVLAKGIPFYPSRGDMLEILIKGDREYFT